MFWLLDYPFNFFEKKKKKVFLLYWKKKYRPPTVCGSFEKWLMLTLENFNIYILSVECT